MCAARARSSRLWSPMGLALQLAIAIASIAGGSAQPVGSDQAGDNAAGISASQVVSTLGIKELQLFPIIPMTRAGLRDHTVIMTLWVKRIQPGLHTLPHQKHSISGFAWLDDPADMNNRVYGHMAMPIDYSSWRPRLMLEVPGVPQPVEAHVYHEHMTDRRFVNPIRPIHFMFPLAPNAGNCFKVYEESRSKYKANFCLPPDTKLCPILAPAPPTEPKSPALWAAINPVRSLAVNSTSWEEYFQKTSGKIFNYVSYHRAMGLSGVLLYADAWQRMYYRRSMRLSAMLKAGHLRFVHWDIIERSHDDDGRGRPLGYNYDQALVASHMLLGMYGCGANIKVLIADLDEYVYTPTGLKWPEVFSKCMMNVYRPTALYTIRRSELLSTRIPPAEETNLWSVPADHFEEHPLTKYDLIAPKPLRDIHSKNIVAAGAGVVAFFVHEGKPLHGYLQRFMDQDNCIGLLHVGNMYGQRRNQSVASTYRPFKHWLFPQAPSAAAAAAGPAAAGNSTA